MTIDVVTVDQPVESNSNDAYFVSATGIDSVSTVRPAKPLTTTGGNDLVAQTAFLLTVVPFTGDMRITSIVLSMLRGPPSD